MSGRRLVVLPTYQEIENIGAAVACIRQACPDADVLVVDDASPDGTAAAAEQAGAHVLRRAGPRGLGPAYVEGYAWGLAHGFEVVAGMDADLSHDAAALPDLFRAIDDGADLAVGSRYVEGGAVRRWPLHRRILSRWGNRYAIALLRLPVRDATSGYRAVSADLLRRLSFDSVPANGYGFLIELLYRATRAGARIVETPITFVDRLHGTSKMRARIIGEAALLVTVWGLRDRLPRPHRAPWLLAAATTAVCLAFMPDYPSDWDGVQLALGVEDFDITHGSPHPPGYWLYVFLGRVVRFLTPWDAATSLTVISALAAGGAVGSAFVAGRRFGGDWLGWAAAACLLTSPYLLFFGATVSTYPFDALVGLLIVLLASQARPGSWHGWTATGLLALGAGFRQTTLIVLAPVALYAVAKSVRTTRAAVAVAGAGLVGVLAWLVPTLVDQPGGWDRYRAFTEEYASNTLVRTSVFAGAPQAGVVNNLGQATGYTLAAVAFLLPVTAFALAARRNRQRTPPALWLAVISPVAFVLLVHFGKAGYVLSFLPALLILLLRPASRLRGGALAVATVLVVVACAVNVQRFTMGGGVLPAPFVDRSSVWFTQQRHGAPYRLTKPEMDLIDRNTRDYFPLRQAFDPRRDVLVYVIGNGGHRFRHAGFTLRDFTTHYVQPGVRHNYARDGVMHYVGDPTVPVPAGGRAVWVLDVPPPDPTVATRHQLPSGRVVWVTAPGTTMYGVTVTAARS